MTVTGPGEPRPGADVEPRNSLPIGPETGEAGCSRSAIRTNSRALPQRRCVPLGGRMHRVASVSGAWVWSVACAGLASGHISSSISASASASPLMNALIGRHSDVDTKAARRRRYSHASPQVGRWVSAGSKCPSEGRTRRWWAVGSSNPWSRPHGVRRRRRSDCSCRSSRDGRRRLGGEGVTIIRLEESTPNRDDSQIGQARSRPGSGGRQRRRAYSRGHRVIAALRGPPRWDVLSRPDSPAAGIGPGDDQYAWTAFD